MKIVIAILASAIPLAPIVFYYFYRRWDNPGRAAQRLLLGFKGFNVLVGLMALAIAVVWFASPRQRALPGWLLRKGPLTSMLRWRLALPWDWVPSALVLL